MRKGRNMDTLWNTFDRVRPKLERQYLEPDFDPSTGADAEELTRRSGEYVAAHSGEPVIRTRAALLELALTGGRIGVDPDDWFADHLEAGDGIRDFRWKLSNEVKESFPDAEERQRCDGQRSGCFDCWLDLSHTTPDWNSILSLGVCGLRDRALAAEKTAKDTDAAEFFRAAARSFEAMRVYIVRLAELAEKKNAVRVAPVLRALSERPPRSFHEALQLAYLYHEVQELEGELVRSMGCFDRLYIDFYRRDIDSGALTRDQAKELLKFFWIKFYARTQGLQAGKNFCFGGVLPDGSDAVNELTVLAYETYREMRVVDPKLTMRVHSGSPGAILRQVADCLKGGLTATVFMNDDVLFPLFLKRGKSPEDVYDYVAIGCYEPAIMGREMCCSMTIIFNLAKPLELLLHGGEDPATGIRLFDAPEREFRSFESFFNACLDVLKRLLLRAMHIERMRTATWSRINPSPLLSGTMPACIASGRDVSEAGAKYNQSGVMCAGIGSVADSLLAVKKLVFEEKRCSLGELAEILRSDWAGREELRMYVKKRLPKWGNNCTEPDELARVVSGFAADLINREPNGKNGTFQMGLWSIDWNRMFGKATGALPDGRRAGEELSKNIGTSAGLDRRGVTALINSSAKLDHTAFPDGSVLDITLHPSAVSGEDGAEVIVDLVRGYFAKGGQSVQFNIFDAATLRKAQRNPEKYANLQVRVCGWNSRFIDLSAEAQEAFIAIAGEEA